MARSGIRIASSMVACPRCDRYLMQHHPSDPVRDVARTAHAARSHRNRASDILRAERSVGDCWIDALRRGCRGRRGFEEKLAEVQNDELFCNVDDWNRQDPAQITYSLGTVIRR